MLTIGNCPHCGAPIMQSTQSNGTAVTPLYTCKCRYLHLHVCIADLEAQLAAEKAAREEAERERDELIDVRNVLILCGERECRKVPGYADKARALIAGLIDTRREKEAAERRADERGAHCEQLRAKLTDVICDINEADYADDEGMGQIVAEASAVLNETPRASLGRHDAYVMREAADFVETKVGCWPMDGRSTKADICARLKAKADELEGNDDA